MGEFNYFGGKAYENEADFINGAGAVPYVRLGCGSARGNIHAEHEYNCECGDADIG